MLRFIVARALTLIPTLFGLILVTFTISTLLPGDGLAAVLSDQAASNPEIVENYRREFGLDKPAPERFFIYVGNVLQGNLGDSIVSGSSVVDDLQRTLPATIELALFGLLIAIVVGGAIGVLAAVKRDSWIDLTARVVAVVASATPVFWLAILLLQQFYVRWGILPGPEGRLSSDVEPPRSLTGAYTIDALLTGNWRALADALQHLVLPASVIAAFFIGYFTRTIRAAMIGVLDAEYVRSARARGLHERDVLFRHAVPAALPPIVTVIGLAIGGLFAGSILTESIFAWPGVGRYAVDAALALDTQAILGVTLVGGVVYSVASAGVDIVHRAVDPRMRAAHER